MVIGLVVIILVGMTIYFVTSSTKRQGQKNVKVTQQSTVRTQQLSNFISSCLEKATKDSLLLSGRQSGYIFTDQNGKEFLSTRHYNKEVDGVNYHIGYGNNVNTKTLIEYSDIASQLEFYIKNIVNDCADFSTFELQGFNVTKTDTENVGVELFDNGVSVNLYYPIEVFYTKLGERKAYDTFNFDIDVSLKNLYDVAEEIIDDYEGFPSVTDGSLNQYRTNYPDLEFTTESLIVDTEDILLVMIKDKNLKIKGQDYVFWFVRDNWETP